MTEFLPVENRHKGYVPPSSMDHTIETHCAFPSIGVSLNIAYWKWQSTEKGETELPFAVKLYPYQESLFWLYISKKIKTTHYTKATDLGGGGGDFSDTCYCYHSILFFPETTPRPFTVAQANEIYFNTAKSVLFLLHMFIIKLMLGAFNVTKQHRVKLRA